MRTISRTGLALVLTSAGLMFRGAQARAVPVSQCITTLPTPPSTPVDCSSTERNLAGFRMGVIGGVSLVDRIWRSHDVEQDVTKWDLVKNAVDTIIPGIVTGFFSSSTGYSDYVWCRAQGLLEGTTCEMNNITPIPGCALDGFDWGVISGSIYCQMSEQFEGLNDVVPWFVWPNYLCADAFQTTCQDVYNHIAAGLSMSVIPPSPRTVPDPDPLCAPYTTGDYSQVFTDSVTMDCTYDIPSQSI